MSQFLNDFNAFFDLPEGTIVDLGNGAKVTKMGDGTAVYQDASGAWVQYDKNANQADLARRAPALAKNWESNEAYQVATNSPNGGTRLDPAARGFYTDDQGYVYQRRPESMGGDYRISSYSLNDIQDPQAKAYFENNLDEFYGFGALAEGPTRSAKSGPLDKELWRQTPDEWYANYFVPSGGGSRPSGGGMAGAAPRPGAVGSSGAGGSTGLTGSGGGLYVGSNPFGGDLSLTQQSLLKALMDQQERDSITGEMRGNANELYDRAQGYEEDALRDIALYTGGNRGIYNRYQPDIENDVATAVADARMGQTQALNTAARQAARYGISMPVSLAGVSTTQASQLASAANNTRNNAINNYRNLVGQGIGLKEGTFRTSQAATADAMGRAEAASMGNRNMRIQDDSLDWAKQLDVTGMARGMPGASQGAYGVAVGAGNSAVQNQMAPGQALIGAMGQANNTTMQGRNLAMQGTLGVLNAQTSYAGTVAKANSDKFGASMDVIGTGLGLAFSDARLKRDVVKVGDDPRGFGWYEFEYVWGGGRQLGVMAQEVERVIPYAVVEVAGYKAVDYGRL